MFPQALIVLVLGVAISGSSFATTYYVAANGNDSNNGTSKSTPWLHAPGMANCVSVCASTTPQAGDKFILRGGDSWHYGNNSLTPFVAYANNAWHWTWSGTSTGCNLNAAAGTIATSSCIYVGVDPTWYSGGSWTRPAMNLDNPLSISSPSSCAYEDSAINPINFAGSYIVFDNLEILGWCWNITNPWGSVLKIGTQNELRNFYFHGWTMGTTATGCGSCDSDEYWMIMTTYSFGSAYLRLDHNVFDGSDSTYGDGTTRGQATGGVFATGAAEIDHNVLVHVSNGMKYAPAVIVHDNYFNNMYEPAVGGTHGNIMEWSPNNYTSSIYYFNNLTANTDEGETIDMYPGSNSISKHGYIFNNIMWGVSNYVNCYMVEGDGTGGPGSILAFNNTTDSQCSMRPLRGSTQAGIFQNNHFISFSPSTLGTFSSLINTDNGNEVFQTEAVANAQGYTSSNNYAPTSSGGATVGAGVNLSSLCASMDNSIAAAACQSGYGGVTYDVTNHTAVDNPLTARPSSGAWDTGAYFFGTAIKTPANLSAKVN